MAAASGRGFVTMAILTSVVWLGPPTFARASDLAAFYRGRTLQLIVGFNTGGSADIYARVIARHIRKHIPGQPTIVVRNMQGAGSLNAANYVYNLSAKDGSEFGLVAGHIATDPLITRGAYKYKAQAFQWIGAPAFQANVCITSPQSPVKTISNALTRDVILGTTGTAGSSTYDFPTLLNNVLGTRMKLVKGYAGSAALKLAMSRGEIEGFCGVGYDFLRGAGLTGDKSNILIQFGLRKSPHMPQVPFVMDLAKTTEQRQMFRLAFGWLNFERAFVMPPGTPSEQVEAMRRGFDATMKDPEFLKDADQALIEIDPMTGAEITQFVKEAYETPASVIEQTATLLGRGK